MGALGETTRWTFQKPLLIFIKCGTGPVRRKKSGSKSSRLGRPGRRVRERDRRSSEARAFRRRILKAGEGSCNESPRKAYRHQRVSIAGDVDYGACFASEAHHPLLVLSSQIQSKKTQLSSRLRPGHHGEDRRVSGKRRLRFLQAGYRACPWWWHCFSVRGGLRENAY